jgi:elongation factor Tu
LEGYFKIIVSHTRKVLDVEGGARRNGTRVQQWDWHGGEHQQWRLEHVADGYYRIIARHSGLCLDVSGISGSNGANVVQWTFVGGWNQLWRIA